VARADGPLGRLCDRPLHARARGRRWRIERIDILLCGALYALFLARINLKDFRDRAGDAAYGKPTLLLAHGKGVTCAVTGLALLAGSATLVAALGDDPGVMAIVSFFAAVILSMLWRLWRTSDQREEQIAIGLGAKMGNGLLACTLASLVLQAEGAPEDMRVLRPGVPGARVRVGVRRD
jgi:4-hydroxybenzoate polyprenyltransferase